MASKHIGKVSSYIVETVTTDGYLVLVEVSLTDLRAAREHHEWTVAEVAELLEVTDSAATKLLSGNRKLQPRQIDCLTRNLGLFTSEKKQ